MVRKPGRQGGGTTIADNIVMRRSEFVDRVQALQKEEQRLVATAQSGKAAVAKTEAKIKSQMSAVRASEKLLDKQRSDVAVAEERATKAEAARAAAQNALDDFDRRLNELVGLAPAKSGVRKARSKPKRSAKMSGAAKGTRRAGARKISQAHALVAVLQVDQGLPVQEVMQRVKEKFGMDIKQSSAGTTLSLLKRDGKIARQTDGWCAIASPPGEEAAGEATEAAQAAEAQE